ncbi:MULTISPECIES: hypothetical protein [Bradyrhizobium]|uniref:hypothetical protein n=1 Tax=Bradyrhizobium TaxID=374 RepID=UPI0013E8B3CC|nr:MULTISPECIES: hypothetical protein [Bradyrhizobium]
MTRVSGQGPLLLVVERGGPVMLARIGVMWVTDRGKAAEGRGGSGAKAYRVVR